MLISVVICTYNRADLLMELLQTVCQQSLSPTEYEVIVVDNNSTDDTAQVCQSFANRYPHIRTYVEVQQGLSHARNRGWQVAKGVYVAYIDDDCKVPRGWLTNAKATIQHLSPDVLSGPYFAFYNSPKPTWFKDAYGSHTPYDKTTKIKDTPDEIHGGNLFLKRSLLKGSNGFDPQLGMMGEQTAYGEETALLRYFQTTVPNLSIYYEPKLFVYHLVRPEKMAWRWLVKAHFSKGRYIFQVCQPEHEKQTFRVAAIGRLLMVSLLLIFDTTIFALFRPQDRQPAFQHYLYESSLEYVKHLGRLYEQYQYQQLGKGSKD